MGAQILSLFGAALAGMMAELLLAQKNSGMARIFRFLVTMVILLLLISPLRSLLQKNEDLYLGGSIYEEESLNYEAIFSETVQTQCEADFKKGLAEMLEKEHHIAPENVTTLVYFDADGTLSRVCLFLSGAALLKDPKALESALSARLGCVVEVR